MLKTATSRNPELEFPLISIFKFPEPEMFKIIYPILEPLNQSKHVLTLGP
jgi:hypothetical protein